MSSGQKFKKLIHNHKNIILSVVVNVFFLLLFYFISGFKYELSDDWFFSENIANGKYNFTFCSYFIQIISGFLQKIIYPFNAFMLLQLIFGFVSMMVIAYVFFDKLGIKKGIVPVLFFESVLSINVYSLITFTKTAAVLITAGGLMILWAHLEKKKIRYYVFGIIMALFGSFYRFKVLYSVFAVFAFFALCIIIFKTKAPFIRGFFKELKEFLSAKFLTAIIIMLALVFSLNSVSRMIFANDSELDYYREYNSHRSHIVDFDIPSFTDEREKYEELGISENDIEMLRNWYLDDEGIAKIDTLKEIEKLQKGRHTNKDFLQNIFMSIVGHGEVTFFLAYFLAAISMMLISGKKSLIFIGGTTAAAGVLYLYLFAIGRCNYRTSYSIWFPVIVCLLYSVVLLEPKEKVRELFAQKKRFFSLFATVICAVSYVFFIAYGILCATPYLSKTVDEDYPELESYITASENKVFALGRSPYVLIRGAMKLDNPLILEENKAFDKCVYFGTPYFGHPSYNELLANFGIDNLYRALTERDDIYFVDDGKSMKIDKMLIYLNEQYGDRETYVAKYVKNADRFVIYKISSAD